MCFLLFFHDDFLGKQGASSTHCCIFCTSADPWLVEGETTTIKTLWRDYNLFLEGGGNIAKARDYNNVVNPPLVTADDGADDKRIRGEVFFPEHHVRTCVYEKF